MVDEAVIDGLVLRHEADPRRNRGRNCRGISIPSCACACAGKPVARRCFVATATKLILPAFGSLTGGLDRDHPEIVRAVGESAQALIAVEDRLLRFPLAA